MEHLKKVEFLVEASVVPVDDERELDQILEAAEGLGLSKEAAGPIGKDGKPRMLLITSWIAHEGRNGNGYAFVRPELDARVRQGLFTPPHGGLMDFNHDYTPIGFWYKSSFAYHDSAEKWGVLANGAIWAWRFPEVADQLLAEQQREGTIKVSMACLAESSEYTQNYPGYEDEFTEVLHNPIFFTTSVLSVPPADPNAEGHVTEDATNPPVAAASNEHSDSDVELVAASRHETKEEVDMDELKEKLDLATAKIADLEARVAELKSFNETLQAEASTAKQEAVAAQTALAEAAKKTDESTNKINELEVALASAVEAREGLEKSLVEATEKLTEYEVKEAEAAKKERLEARLAELPEVVRDNLEDHPENEAILEALASASDEDWTKTKTLFALASGGADYKGRSDREGRLPSATGKTGLSSIDHYLR